MYFEDDNYVIIPSLDELIERAMKNEFVIDDVTDKTNHKHCYVHKYSTIYKNKLKKLKEKNNGTY